MTLLSTMPTGSALPPDEQGPVIAEAIAPGIAIWTLDTGNNAFEAGTLASIAGVGVWTGALFKMVCENGNGVVTPGGGAATIFTAFGGCDVSITGSGSGVWVCGVTFSFTADGGGFVEGGIGGGTGTCQDRL